MGHSTTGRVEKVIEHYQAYVQRRNPIWDAPSRPRPEIDPAEVSSITQETLGVLGFQKDVEKFLKNVAPEINIENLSFRQLQDILLLSLRVDLEQCLTDDQKEFFKDVHLKFLRTGFTNASCVNADVSGEPLDFFLAFLNEGLYFSLQQLFTALVYEEMQGDLAPYKRDGSEAFEAAIQLYIKPNSSDIKPVPEYVGDLEASGEIGAHITSASTLVLQFVALHEFAHAWLGHHEILEAHRMNMAAEIFDDSSSEISYLNHKFEFEADEFAFRALLGRTSSIEGQWANCFAIYLFFCYLDKIENRIGRPLSELHPSPMKRAERLQEILQHTFPHEAYREDELFRLRAMVNKWVE